MTVTHGIVGAYERNGVYSFEEVTGQLHQSGPNKMENYQTMCSPCNGKKSDKII